MLARRAVRAASLLAAALIQLPACSDDEPTAPGASLIATWNATSFVTMGQDFIAQGMTLRMVFSAAGTYTLTVGNDLIGACAPNPDCVETGNYTATTTQLTIDPGPDETVFTYTIQGTVLTLTGSIDGTAVTIILSRA